MSDVRNKKGFIRKYALLSTAVSSSDKCKSLSLAGLQPEKLPKPVMCVPSARAEDPGT